ncbi:IclR family transcriptional regulator [Sphingomonas sp. ERG5]|uniref:IclR family transcriptional regulator n=1 Tax=Sphingomonas sp. ERG5 TaxID=1381597 RepID=UPI00054C3AE5|nr:helix-turn-helix domain-containing protein [Sphingomonas sp. ERG5]
MALVKSVSHAFSILRMLPQNHALSLSEIARLCGLSPSSCHGLLKTLVAEGVLEIRVDKRYAWSPGWSVLPGALFHGDAKFTALARPLLTRCAIDHNMVIGLWRVAKGDRLHLTALGESAATTRIHMTEGQRQPIGSGAAGRALAASQHIDRDEIARRYAGVRWEQPLTLSDYADQISQAAAMGYAIDDDFGHAGVCSIAVALTVKAPIDALVSASIFSSARTDAVIQRAVQALRDLADELDQLRS